MSLAYFSHMNSWLKRGMQGGWNFCIHWKKICVIYNKKSNLLNKKYKFCIKFYNYQKLVLLSLRQLRVFEFLSEKKANYVRGHCMHVRKKWFFTCRRLLWLRVSLVVSGDGYERYFRLIELSFVYTSHTAIWNSKKMAPVNCLQVQLEITHCGFYLQQASSRYGYKCSLVSLCFY